MRARITNAGAGVEQVAKGDGEQAPRTQGAILYTPAKETPDV